MRLIDADELMEHAWRDKLDSRELIAGMIAKAPTIKEIPKKIPIGIFEKMVSQEPCEDAISREELYNALYDHFHDEDSQTNMTDVSLGAIRNFVRNFPSVYPKAQENILAKIRAIVNEWQLDTWTDNLSYECMVKIAELVEPQESEAEE